MGEGGYGWDGAVDQIRTLVAPKVGSEHSTQQHAAAKHTTLSAHPSSAPNPVSICRLCVIAISRRSRANPMLGSNKQLEAQAASLPLSSSDGHWTLCVVQKFGQHVTQFSICNVLHGGRLVATAVVQGAVVGRCRSGTLELSRPWALTACQFVKM